MVFSCFDRCYRYLWGRPRKWRACLIMSCRGYYMLSPGLITVDADPWSVGWWTVCQVSPGESCSPSFLKNILNSKTFTCQTWEYLNNQGIVLHAHTRAWELSSREGGHWVCTEIERPKHSHCGLWVGKRIPACGAGQISSTQCGAWKISGQTGLHSVSFGNWCKYCETKTRSTMVQTGWMLVSLSCHRREMGAWTTARSTALPSSTPALTSLGWGLLLRVPTPLSQGRKKQWKASVCPSQGREAQTACVTTIHTPLPSS